MPALRYTDGLRPNMLALVYVFMAYIFGVILLLHAPIWGKFIAIIPLAHAMVIAAYLVHECAHNTIFADKINNARLGGLLNWITGACYERFEDIRHKHNRHHTDRADIVAFDYRTRLRKRPILLKLIQTMEWCYIPAVELMMHSLTIILPFKQAQRSDKRLRILLILSIRIGLLYWLYRLSPLAPIIYAMAYLAFLTIVHFMDVHQHTYEIYETLDQKRPPKLQHLDRKYEQEHTYSNLISTKYPWLNLITLNFGYHNAHHERPTLPWYRLPKFHTEQSGNSCEQLLPFGNLLRSYHKFRVARILGEHDEMIGTDTMKGSNFAGADGVSFLTAH